MIPNSQRVALPPLLRQGLIAFRETVDGDWKYRIQDNWKGLTYQLEPWQFFVLEVMPLCDNFDKLASVFEDRFGHGITMEELEKLFALLDEMKILGLDAEAHPLCAAYRRKVDNQPIRLTGPSDTGVRAEAHDAGDIDAIARGAADVGMAGDGRDSGAASEKEEKGVGPESTRIKGLVSDQADFTSREFRRPSDLVDLCAAVRNDGYDLHEAGAHENSVEWLNDVLKIPDLSEQVLSKKPSLHLTDEIVRLMDETSSFRSRSSRDLGDREKRALKILNRLIIEEAYPRLAPRHTGDDRSEKRGWHLFHPAPFLKAVLPVCRPLRHVVYLLPPLFITAFVVAYRHADMMKEDFARFMIGIRYVHFTYFAHTMIGMFTDNLLATFLIAIVAYSYNLPVDSFFIELHFGFYPRFHVRVRNWERLFRRERIWFHAAPLLGRFSLIALCILAWFVSRPTTPLIASFSLTLAVIAVASLYLSANPLVKSSGYYLMVAWLNEDNLRSKAALSIVNKLKGNRYGKLDRNVLVAYALASALFMILTFVVFILMFGSYVKYHFGGAGVFITLVLVVLLLFRLAAKARKISEVYERSLQFERWKKVSINKEAIDVARSDKKRGVFKYLMRSAPFALLVLLIVPYHYEPSGSFVVLPSQRQEITSEVAGVIRDVYYDGGEFLKKGSVVAKLADDDYTSQLQIYKAKIDEQKAIVHELMSKPRPEELQLVERELNVQETKLKFSSDKMARMERLYVTKTISLEELEDARQEKEVDAKEVEELRAKLALVKSGATPDEIEAAKGKLQSYREKYDYYNSRVEQTFIRMPFDGKLVGMNLKQLKGHYLGQGDPFGIAENTSQVLAEIEVPEPDIGYAAADASVRGRTFTYYDKIFNGKVTQIDSVVTPKSSGNVVKVQVLLDNRDGLLKSGMTGYAKIECGPQPVWKVMSLAMIRFFKVEVWSWVP
ncbi:MAG: HlyD family efflux transporter periplasmic adaptor subunit [Deltaproteobacteria bacterium]|nr:HlyD family efflux transporter periplasmic adaptor subunit [Deltaproteobacteria bacterium]